MLKRQFSLQSLWSSEHRDEFALLFVMYGLHAEAAFPPPPTMEIPLPLARLSVLLDTFVEPVSRSISAHSDGSLTMASVRSIVTFPSPVAINRVLLLWCLDKWKHFRPATCLICGIIFSEQDHITECAELVESLLADPLLDPLEVSPSNPLKIVEAYISSASQLPHDRHPLLSLVIPAIVGHICDAIRRVRGVGPLIVVE